MLAFREIDISVKVWLLKFNTEFIVKNISYFISISNPIVLAVIRAKREGGERDK